MGVDLSSDKRRGIHFDNYIDNCIKKGYKSLWSLRRLAELGVSKEYLFLTYNSRIRVNVEQNSPLYMFNMTKSQKEKIEQLQKLSFFIILGKHASRSYSHNLAILKSSTLEERRQKIATNFANKILKNSEHRKKCSK